MKRILVASLALLAAAGCGNRGAAWDASVDHGDAGGTSDHVVGLSGALALLDPGADRVMMVSSGGDLSLAFASLPMGRGFVKAASTFDQSHLLVLTRGDVPRRTLDDQGPALSLYDGSISPHFAASYPLLNPLTGLQIDPLGKYAVVHASSDDTAFVLNPNELIVSDLEKKPSASNPRSVTLRSFGGAPSSFYFTPSLGVPGGARRMLVALTDRDIGLVDLEDTSSPGITVPLSDSDESLSPFGVAVSDGDPDVADDALIAIQLSASEDVVILRFDPPEPGGSGVHPVHGRAKQGAGRRDCLGYWLRSHRWRPSSRRARSSPTIDRAGRSRPWIVV